jgi:hemerythrin
MPLLLWREDYSVGIRIIDSQHKRLVELLNAIYDASRVGKGRDVLGKSLAELVSYTFIHFGTEEDFMMIHGYPDYGAHKAEHEALAQKVIDFQREFESGKAALTAEVMLFLRDWLNDHILQTDRKIGPFLTSRGVY